ncbi:MAG: YlxM family DNA-binding protein [Lachnospiraceae bacterium]
MDRIVEQSLLYDFYGELLTEHQRHVYEAAVFEDLSLSEIAQEQGISRQGVHDLLKRCNKILEDYEGKLHLVEKFRAVKQSVGDIRQIAEQYRKCPDPALMEEIERISADIMKEL